MLKTFESHEITHMEKDSVFIWHINPGKKAYPLKNINSDDQKHLYNLIKVANKSAAHLTIKTSSIEELESLEPARRIIYRLIFDYVDGLNKQVVW